MIQLVRAAPPVFPLEQMSCCGYMSLAFCCRLSHSLASARIQSAAIFLPAYLSESGEQGKGKRAAAGAASERVKSQLGAC
jgi:hypothetical protein